MAVTVKLAQATLDRLLVHLEASYPNEGAGFLLGQDANGVTEVAGALPIENKWDESTQARRYLLEPRDWLRAEDAAEEQSLAVVGIFHSHPDHPPRPSEFDLDMALPNLAYLITSVQKGKAVETRAWRLGEDRAGFEEDELLIT